MIIYYVRKMTQVFNQALFTVSQFAFSGFVIGLEENISAGLIGTTRYYF